MALSYTDAGFTANALICDSAASAETKLYIQGGGWTNLTTSRFPFNQPRIAVALVLSVPWTATNHNHDFELRLEDEDGALMALGGAVAEDGSPIKRIKGQFNIGRPAGIQPGDAQPMPLAFNFDQMLFEAPGTYTFVIAIDDEELSRLPFRVTGIPGIS